MSWIQFVKAFAKKHNITYGAALANPQTSAEYKKQKK